MKGDQVPDADNVTRLCGGAHISEDGSPEAPAFMLNIKKGEDYLSVNWLEHLGLADRASEIREIQRVMATKRTVGAITSKLAVLNVGQSRVAVRERTNDQREITISHEPEEPPLPSDPSHSGIYNLPLHDNTAAEQLAGAVLETHPAR